MWFFMCWGTNYQSQIDALELSIRLCGALISAMLLLLGFKSCYLKPVNKADLMYMLNLAFYNNTVIL